MLGLFAFCSSLTTLDVSAFNTQKVKDMYGMFALCDRLQDITFGPNFTTSLVEDMGAMFAASFSLQTLDLSTFNTPNVQSFQGDPIIDYHDPDKGTVETSGYDSSDLGMFSNCMSLTTIFCGNDWNTASVQNSDYMFFNCRSLVGGYGTEYDSNHVNVSYAHPDAEGNLGYFTLDTEVITGNKPGNKTTYWTTYYYGPTNTYIANADGQETTVYIAKMEEVNGERVLTMTAIEDGVIKAGQGVVIESNQQSITMKHSAKKAAAGNFDTNELKGCTFKSARPTDEGTIYTMGNVNGNLGFYKLKDTVTTLAARKAYLTIQQSNDAGFRFNFEESEATGIEDCQLTMNNEQ